MKTSKIVMAGVAAVGLAGPLAAQTKTAWLHIRVEEASRESKVSVNLPLPVVEAALAMAPEKFASHGRIRLDEHGKDLKVADLRRMWNELRATGQAEIVSIEARDEKVRVAKEGDRVLIRVEKLSSKEAVRVDVPVAVVDALLSGEGDELNIEAAMGELKKLRGDIVHVNDADSTVRIWIDERM
jgi:hypothetical protein